MTIDTNDQLRRYARRGTSRGADQVLAAAQAEANSGPSYISPIGPDRHRPRFAMASIAAAAVMALVVAGALHQRSGTPSDTTYTTQPAAAPPSPLSAAQIEEANNKLAQNEANGWVPYGDTTLSGRFIEGWTRFDKGANPVGNGAVFEPSSVPGQPPRISVYDQPDGTIIGYIYMDVGIVEPEVANSPTFDAAAARIEMLERVAARQTAGR